MNDYKKLGREANDKAMEAWDVWNAAKDHGTHSQAVIDELLQAAKYWGDKRKDYERMALGDEGMAAHRAKVKRVLADYEAAAGG